MIIKQMLLLTFIFGVTTNNILAMDEKPVNKSDFEILNKGFTMSGGVYIYPPVNNLSPELRRRIKLLFFKKEYADRRATRSIEYWEQASDFSQCFTDTDILHKYAKDHNFLFCPDITQQLNRYGELEKVGVLIHNTQNRKYCDLAKEYLAMERIIDTATATVSQYQ